MLNCWRKLRWYGRTIVHFFWKLTGLHKTCYVKATLPGRRIDAESQLYVSSANTPLFLSLVYAFKSAPSTCGTSLWTEFRACAFSTSSTTSPTPTNQPSLPNYAIIWTNCEVFHVQAEILLSSHRRLGGPIYCGMLHDRFDLSGPFRDEEHMNLQLRRERPPESFPDAVPEVHSVRHRLVLTHNDFAARNIMVEEKPGEGWRVSAIIDWETSGWLPSYWEY
ncbi:hypothetical protein CPB85DRAFT_1435821 [Mucidula mucida]|nr:hypothetical protein CPB85DRAFT_1435821 [Mucidula mucida]